MRHAVFVVPFSFHTSLRFLASAVTLEDAAISLISQDPLDRFDPAVASRLAAHVQVEDGLDPEQIVGAVRDVERRTGHRVERLLGVLEQLQVPLAEARAVLGLPGLDPRTAHNVRDKSRMKEVLRAHGVPCARSGLAATRDEAVAFIREVGLPVVVKPPAGAGAVDTFRVDAPQQLDEVLTAAPPRPGRPVLLEEFIVGEEHSWDAVVLDGRVVWHSISRYAPAPLEVLRNNWIQWTVLLPREIDGPEYEGIRRAGPAALSALGVENALCHMEWFRRPDGSVAVSEVGARPPGAQFTTLLSVAHDTDMYTAWSRLVVHETFDPPARPYAAGAAYLRGQGRGRVVAVHGLDRAHRELGDLVVDVQLPRRGQARSRSYEGEGYVVLRHPDTAVVAHGLQRLVRLVHVELG